MSREVVVASAVRTAIGTFGGSLKDVPPTELAALALYALVLAVATSHWVVARAWRR